ncbi:MAG: hypothetical protein BGO47_00855 [Microbacterium sp. 67-17]|uniref:tyrosine-protein phosphatase n=1 Tax=Microbacterium sp. 67-17 TaxID=1895782 RepID=UPI000962EDD8|nr:tyrosine-protein phosphatase [Microbacterium sp. 67-17]OJV98541.1 MAG: hypothetical protein BGO47_00855 [Microbacterium sp. 67-17]
MTQRALDIDGLANARDLGGIARRDRSLTPTGVFFRSEKLDRIGPAGWDRLREYGVATVIDLRRPDERSGAVPTDIAHVHVDLDGDEREFWEVIEADGRWATPLYYNQHLESLPHRMASVVRPLADAQPGGVLFHCAAGWDRTGLVTALLLRAADVGVDEATADYLQSFATSLRSRLCTGAPFTLSSGGTQRDGGVILPRPLLPRCSTTSTCIGGSIWQVSMSRRVVRS